MAHGAEHAAAAAFFISHVFDVAERDAESWVEEKCAVFAEDLILSAEYNAYVYSLTFRVEGAPVITASAHVALPRGGAPRAGEPLKKGHVLFADVSICSENLRLLRHAGQCFGARARASHVTQRRGVASYMAEELTERIGAALAPDDIHWAAGKKSRGACGVSTDLGRNCSSRP